MSATQRILGVRFFDGTVEDAVRTMSVDGGLLVAPAAPALVDIQYDAAYRDALVRSDLAIADSGFMVLLWRLLKRRRMPRISGLVYLQQLLATLAGSVFFILPTEAARDKAITWLRAHRLDVDVNGCYVAPQYDRSEVSDRVLVELLNARRSTHVIIGIGGGVQEKLGLYLRDALNYRPAIHCIGAALAFLTGDQKSIPRWADRLYLGWLLRLARDPRRYARRFAVARELPRLIARYGADLPPLIGR